MGWCRRVHHQNQKKKRAKNFCRILHMKMLQLFFSFSDPFEVAIHLIFPFSFHKTVGIFRFQIPQSDRQTDFFRFFCRQKSIFRLFAIFSFLSLNRRSLNIGIILLTKSLRAAKRYIVKVSYSLHD